MVDIFFVGYFCLFCCKLSNSFASRSYFDQKGNNLPMNFWVLGFLDVNLFVMYAADIFSQSDMFLLQNI